MAQFYEHKREGHIGPAALVTYVRRWNGWLKGGLVLASNFRLVLLPPPHYPETTKASEGAEEEG